MENRRVLPPLHFEKGVDPRDTKEAKRTGGAKGWEKMSIDERLKHVKDPDEAEDAETRIVKKLHKKSYTIDEITTAQLLKGHPQAQEILDTFFKSNKKTEGGEEFQDGSEDTIGGEGHASPGRPGTIKHEGGGEGPDHPGTKTKKASVEDGDLEKAQERGTLTDNEPNEFKEGIEDDDTIPEGDEGEEAEEIQVGKSQDEQTLEFLQKTMGSRFTDAVEKAIVGGYKRTGYKEGEDPKKPGEGVAGGPTSEQKEKAAQERSSLSRAGLANLTAKVKASKAGVKSECDFDLEKSEEVEEQMEKDYSLEFSEDILKAMGLEKGSPSVSKKVSGGKATQIRYGADKGEEEGKTGKPETRYTHPKGKTEKRYRFEPTKGEVTVRERPKGEKEFKERKIGVGEEKKLKEASEGQFDLHKTLDEILAKRG